MWLLLALSGPILWAVSTHIDKFLLDKYFKDSDVAVLMVFTALAGVLMLPAIWWTEPQVVQAPALDVAVMSFSGALYMGAMLFYLRALQSEDASGIAPLFQMTPVFSFVLAYAVLGERLTALQMLSGLLILGGAVVVSIGSSASGAALKRRSLWLMVLCTGALALSAVIFKLFAVRDEFWRTTFWSFAGQVLFGAAILAVPSYRKQFISLLAKSTGAVMAINAANELINLGGGLGVRYATVLGPLTIVQAISGTSTLFVFAIGVLLALIAPSLGHEDLSRSNLIRKGIAAALVAAGVALANQS
jgi:uncharacterized membrane protein